MDVDDGGDGALLLLKCLRPTARTKLCMLNKPVTRMRKLHTQVMR